MSATVAELGSLALAEADDAEAAALAGALFEKHFHATVPAFPRHFVLVETESDAPALGYVHHTRFDGASLAGGLVVAALRFRALDRETQDLVRAQGGLAEWIMRASCAFVDADAVFAYMGDRQSIRVNLRVGFAPTAHRYLHVLWKGAVALERRRTVVERVAALGAF